MKVDEICDCPFTEWCHESRQWLQETFRKEDKHYEIKDCDFYKLIKKDVDRIPTVNKIRKGEYKNEKI